MVDDKRVPGIHVSLDSIAKDVFGSVDTDPRYVYRSDPLRYFKEKHNFKLPPILEYVFYRVYNSAKDAVDGVGDRTYGLDMIICAARGAGKSLFASMLEFSLWYFLDADCVNMGGSLHSDTFVHTDVGPVLIKDIKVDMRVISSDGKLHKVLGNSVTNNDGAWMDVLPFGSNKPLRLTTDHKVLTQRGFVPAEELTLADHMIIPIVVSKEYKASINWSIPKSRNQFSKKLERLQKINFHHPDFYRLIGYYIAEGCSGGGRTSKYARIAFSLSTDNDQYILADIKELSKRFFLVEPHIYENWNDNDSVRMVHCAVAPFQDFFAQFGNNAKRKRIPMEWLGLPEDCLIQLIRGMWDGDGHIRRSKSKWGTKRSECGYSTSSEELAQWLRHALHKIGVTVSVTSETQKVSELISKHQRVGTVMSTRRYKLSICGSAFYTFMLKVYNEKCPWVFERNGKAFDVKGYEKSYIKDGNAYYRIKSLKKLGGHFDHYDIQVEGMHDFCTLNGVVHNSEEQALIVYGYVCSYIDTDSEVSKVVDKRTISVTNKKGASPAPSLNCITASPKSIRGRHPGARRKAPGILIADEAAEILDGLIKQALPMTKEARPPFNLIISTFHHAFGDFQEFWDNAEDRGFIKLSLDSFDVCEKCVDECSKCIPEFDETYCQLICSCYYDYSKKIEDRPSWHRYYYKEKFDYTHPEAMPKGCISPESCDVCTVEGCTAPKIRVKTIGDLGKECPTCKAVIDHKARWGVGHFAVEEIRKAWRRNDKVTFEVEYMGWRPGRGIFVLDPYDVDMSMVPDTKYSVYGSTRLGIDWGAAGTTAMVIVQYNPDNSIDILDYYDMQSPSDTECYDMVGRLCRRYKISLIYADSSHVFQNTHIRNELNIMLTPVNFQTQKELGVGVMRMKFERKLVKIPERFKQTLVKDLKNWRRDVNGNILKKNDHGPDALLCAMLEGSLFGEVISAPPEVEEDLRENTFQTQWERSSF